jgi:uncharacterized protein (TIGR02270 family)
MSTTIEPLPALIEESLEEAIFLWTRWESDLTSLTRNLDEIWRWTEDRLFGAIDGVRIAPARMLERRVRDAMQAGLAGSTVAAHVLTTSTVDNARGLLGDLITAASGETLDAMLRGIEAAPLDGSFTSVAKLLAEGDPEHCAGLGRLKAFRRARLGEELTRAYESKYAPLQIKVLKAIAYLPDDYVAAWVVEGMKHDNPAARLAAIDSGIQRRVPNAWSAALHWVRSMAPEAAPLLRHVAMFGNDAEHEMVANALQEPALRRSAIWALGHVGTRTAAECCLDLMQDVALAPLAAEAYCTITGAELAKDRLSTTDASADAGSPSFEEDDLDANLIPAAADLWPLPDLDAVRQHWASVHDRFQPGGRYLRGREMSLDWLMTTIEQGPMLRRPDHIFEAFVRTQGRYDVEPRATGPTQKRMMAVSRRRMPDTDVQRHAATRE